MSYACPFWKEGKAAREEGEPWEKKEKRKRERKLEKREEVLKEDFSLILVLVAQSALMWITLCYAGYKSPAFQKGILLTLRKILGVHDVKLPKIHKEIFKKEERNITTLMLLLLQDEAVHFQFILSYRKGLLHIPDKVFPFLSVYSPLKCCAS